MPSRGGTDACWASGWKPLPLSPGPRARRQRHRAAGRDPARAETALPRCRRARAPGPPSGRAPAAVPGSQRSNPAPAHRNVAQAHRNVEQAHRNVAQAHRNVKQAHRNVKQAHRNVEQAHRNVEQAHRNVKQAHRNVKQAHRNVKQGHRNVKQAHRNVKQAHRNVAQAHRNVAQGWMRASRMQRRHGCRACVRRGQSGSGILPRVMLGKRKRLEAASTCQPPPAWRRRCLSATSMSRGHGASATKGSPVTGWGSSSFHACSAMRGVNGRSSSSRFGR